MCPCSKHHTCSSDLANAGLLRGTSSLNAYSFSGSFYDLPIPSHGKNRSIPKVPATPKCQSLPAWPGRPKHVRMTRLIWAQSAQSSAVQRRMCGWWTPGPGWPWKHCPTSTEAVIWWQAILVFSPTQWIGGVPAHFTQVIMPHKCTDWKAHLRTNLLFILVPQKHSGVWLGVSK